jgi:hypothetical protein
MYLYKSKNDWSIGSYRKYSAPTKGFCFYIDIDFIISSQEYSLSYIPYIDMQNQYMDDTFKARINRYLKRYVFV